MQKIPTIFVRDFTKTKKLVTKELNPECKWIYEDGVYATVKHDGTCCLIKQGEIYKRYDAKHGKTPPKGFIPAQSPDEKTGHWPGWVLCEKDNPADKWHFEAFQGLDFPDGTYELCGPKINGNREKLNLHVLIRHGIEKIDVKPDYESLKEFLDKTRIEGLVFYSKDGKMAKIKRSDFGHDWP